MIDYYPTIQHQNATNKFLEIFSKDSRIKTILLIGSCARCKASKDSCLDLCVIVKNKHIKSVIKKFERLKNRIKEFKDVQNVGRFSQIDLEVTEAKFKPKERSWTSGPDSFELEIGNIFRYSVVLFDKNSYFKNLSKNYLPYYSEKLRKNRLNEVKKFLYNNLEHVPLYTKRKLYFQAFDRLYKASQEFMQAVFIKNKIYPIAYDKWVKEQYINILKMPKLYNQIVDIISIKNFEGVEILKKARKLKKLANSL